MLRDSKGEKLELNDFVLAVHPYNKVQERGLVYGFLNHHIKVKFISDGQLGFIDPRHVSKFVEECLFCTEDAAYFCTHETQTIPFYCCDVCAKDLGPAYEIQKLESFS